MLDVDEPRFADDFSQFRRVVQDLERRLASVIIQVGGLAGLLACWLAGWLVAMLAGGDAGWLVAGGGWLSRSAAFPAIVLALRRPSSLQHCQLALKPHPSLPCLHHPLCCAAQGFDECTSVGASFKLFESFEGLVDRDAISADLERKHAELVRSFVFELQEVSAVGCGLGLGRRAG